MKPATYVEQKSSALLTKEENEQIFKLLGYKCQTLATTVVQLFSTDGLDGMQWIKKDVGVLCLVRDINKRSYFFRLFCLLRNRIVWEHEIYNSMQYLAPKSFLHTFEAEKQMIAFNFAHEEEAVHMRGILLEKLEQKNLVRKNRGHTTNSRNSVCKPPTKTVRTPNLNMMSNGYLSNESPSTKSTNKKWKKKSITKADIGIPLNFQHVSHVGWHADTGFELENVDPSMRQFFDKAGISENDLKDEKTREFIYDFIERHGGIDAVKLDIHPQAPPPPVPARNVPTTPSPMLRSAPPPPPYSNVNRNVSTLHPTPPPPPLTPPPSNVVIQKNQDHIKKSVLAMKSPPSNIMAPPPPPPLPPPSIPNDENATSNSNTVSQKSTSEPDHRNALMDAIRHGTTLKHVEADSKKLSGADNSRGELLNQIRQGVELKSVQPGSKSPHNTLPADGLAGALARALAERSKAIHSDSSETSDTDDYENDEWEDY